MGDSGDDVVISVTVAGSFLSNHPGLAPILNAHVNCLSAVFHESDRAIVLVYSAGVCCLNTF